ncbi:hypothetical protein LPJ66_000772 [Kickxella alabastrina]|uniref:Uncharacterized protein n=1 Tax=Kickxella alabastrina TaxID=61397 RepID=A0ACC1IV21_9FUNG|nr:hypothetical protein LPJ66_000772 [Kickxella alabastrina]
MPSHVAQDADEETVTLYVKYSMDKPSAAFMQMPVFTKAKPSMTKCHVLFDNLSNNLLNIVSIGMQLPTPLKHVMFLHDAKLVLSVDMESFFMQLFQAAYITDFKTYDGSSMGKVHTGRMVQDNSESPAITQAFLTHMLSNMPQVKMRIMSYVDNVYLKSLTGNEAEHVNDIGHLFCCLSHPNVTMNMIRTFWCANTGVEALGHMWSADCT